MSDPSAPVLTGDRVIAPLREARAPLYSGLRTLQVAAEAVTAGEPAAVALPALDAALAYLDSQLLAYSRAEEFTLFPAVDGVIGQRGASLVMEAQHRTLVVMAGDLRTVVAAAHDARDAAAYSRYLLPLLHGLYALARAHLEAEDEVYLTLLDEHLSESQVGVVVDNLQRIATNAPPPNQDAPPAEGD